MHKDLPETGECAPFEEWAIWASSVSGSHGTWRGGSQFLERLARKEGDPGVDSSLKEGVFAWVKGIGSQFRVLCSGIHRAWR